MSVFGGVIHPGPYRFHPQLVTREIPFPDLDDYSVSPMVCRGVRPPKPQSFDVLGISPAVWEIAEMCWHQEANQRPRVKAVLRCLEEIANLVSTQYSRGVLLFTEGFGWFVVKVTSVHLVKVNIVRHIRLDIVLLWRPASHPLNKSVYQREVYT